MDRSADTALPDTARPDKPDLSDAVRAAQQGDQQAFRVLYRDVQPRLLRYLRAMVGDDAEDVASEAWLHIARDLPGFSGDSDGFRGWAATIARHRGLDHQRRHRRRPQPRPPRSRTWATWRPATIRPRAPWTRSRPRRRWR